MKITFLLNTKAEFLKTRKSFMYWLTLLAAFFIPLINFIILIERPDVMVSKFQADPWLTFLRFNWKNMASIILPMYIILITNLIVQIEYRNNTWKQVYTTPRTFADIFFSKLVVIHIVLPVFIIFFSVFVILSGLSVALVNKNYHLAFATVHWNMVLVMALRIYISVFAMIVIQYWLSLRFRNFVIPVGIGLAMWIIGIVLIEWDKIIYFPYMYSVFMFFTDFEKEPDKLSVFLITSVVAFMIVLPIGFWDIYKLKERG